MEKFKDLDNIVDDPAVEFLTRFFRNQKKQFTFLNQGVIIDLSTQEGLQNEIQQSH